MLDRRSLSLLAAAGIAPVIVAFLPAAIANAHGYVSSPLSRQAQCAKGLLPCGDIKYEPQSVEAPKGSNKCSGGNARFPELDDDTKPWQVQSVGSTVTFTWTFTALHRTLNWEYYIGSTRVAVFDGGDNPPPASGVSHTVDLSAFSGRQKLLAVWNIGDTVNAFYSCVDLQIGSGGTPSTTTTPPTTTAPPTTTTTPPTTTTQPTTTTSPPTTTAPQPTTSTGKPASNSWKVGAHYNVGDVVTYDGMTYRCLQAHTVYDPGWNPEAAPALWQMTD
ncbi:lytic polysaccharide monooxygenase [Nocardia sp. CDC153]|uniref:lytic polysaccharide monooxygenase n=1 Tax=Nocardia sp. CDC153 TaxID=3112167 RepID=UPI002DBED8E0|nr:lytic polysaccharide monooxygenase [Nocardia sp. CDC153]MEC3958304.1 lytic polysaccharide monooxygenase [Nocardia sp. CDC153]